MVIQHYTGIGWVPTEVPVVLRLTANCGSSCLGQWGYAGVASRAWDGLLPAVEAHRCPAWQ